ncbi:hypothetical protein ARTHRO_11777 [Limnospira indica PCC 8005]|uniref:Uncharacterized protein n=1 Tax=Limnospira indica PCC 8005 TaxID=376219 RepID=A0A9P1NYP2_9CYAN|nr:hypothetical protein ARTHRO_11777 [Limnospira indica PCC 8005]
MQGFKGSQGDRKARKKLGGVHPVTVLKEEAGVATGSLAKLVN